MTATCSISRQGSVAIIEIDNPPVNATSQSVRAGITAALATIGATDARAVVLACKGRTFVAGADIREFNLVPQEPHLPDVVQALSAFDRPIVAALHGTALGGGLELALGCHFRVAVATARMGLPEVNLGLIPGAGGTQILPRLIGIELAVDMITSGRMVSASAALTSGLIDKVVDGDLLAAAIAFAESAERSSATPIAGVPIVTSSHDAAWFDKQRARIRHRARGQKSPLAALESIQNTTTMSLQDGLAAERRLFMACKSSEQSNALRHIFFAERATAKSVDFSQARAAIRSAAVVGAGTMGAGIALSFANAGIPVTVLETNTENLEQGLARIESTLDKAVQLGKLSAADRVSRGALIAGTLEYEALSDVDIAVEAVFESMEVKHAVFSALNVHCKADAILATNTSYLDIDEIATVVDDPSRVVGLHFFSPADRMKLLEVVKAGNTSEATLASAMRLAKRLGKIGVPVGVCFGFAANRSYTAYQGVGQQLLLEGVSPARLDAALTRFGMAMGPCAVMDLSGIDIGYAARQQNPNPPADPRWFAPANALAEAGYLGRKTGAGFYLYGDKGSDENPAALELIASEAARLSVDQRNYSDEQIVSAVLSALVDEGEAILHEGIVDQASDMDVIWVNGYGFPRHLGGPFFYVANLN